MDKKTKFHAGKLLAIFISIAIIFLVMSTTLFVNAASNTYLLSFDGKFYTDYETYEDAYAAAVEHNQAVVAEGMVLLKNENKALPMPQKNKATGYRNGVSVFGRPQTYMVGANETAGMRVTVNKADTTVPMAFENDGFRVNSALKNFYDPMGTPTWGEESHEFPRGVEQSFNLYNDLAVVVLGRVGGEGSDMPRNTGEVEDEKDANGNAYDWTHNALEKDKEGKAYKHYFQLTDSEEELIKYVKSQNFKRIMVLVNCSTWMEFENLQNDPEIDSILWMGRPGVNGIHVLPKLVSGEITPSGKTADLWYRDFSDDPTWFNFGDNSQTGSTNAIYVENEDGTVGDATGHFQIEYDEDIYIGYRYYETAAKDASDGNFEGFNYDDQVVYPFGYGLSYTDFTYENMKVYTDKNCTTELGSTVQASQFSSSVNSKATVDKLYVKVDVKNGGTEYSAKEAVEIYVTAPFTNKVQKPHVQLVGFGKTSVIAPGKSETITIEVNVQDMASYDALGGASEGAEKGYVLETGDYTVRAMANSHGWADTSEANYKEVKFNLSGNAYLHLDDFSENEITNQFSKENSIFYSLRDASVASTAEAFNANSQELMKRGSFATTFPEKHAELDAAGKPVKGSAAVATKKFIEQLEFWENYSVGASTTNGGKNKFEAYPTDKVDQENDPNMPWVAEALAAFAAEGSAAEWTQADTGTETFDYKVSDLAGLDYESDNVIDDEKSPFNGMTEAEAWVKFMNGMTLKDLKDIVGQYQKKAFPKIGMNQLLDCDNISMGTSYGWEDNTVLSSTWNVDLAARQGIIAGNLVILRSEEKGGHRNVLWGISIDFHRSPFNGRNYEAYSSDGLHAGLMAAPVVNGLTSRGICTYIKHCALNNQETNRNSKNLFAWVSEQAIREIYLKPFQMAVQEGNGNALMGAFARVGSVSVNVNYNFITGLFRKEFGFRGAITSDMYSPMSAISPSDMMMRAGSDNTATLVPSGEWRNATDTDKGMVMVGANNDVESKVQWYTMRNCAMYFVYAHANTAMNRNGIDISDWSTKTFTVQQGSAITEASVKSALGDSTSGSSRYEIASGALPKGLTLGADGTIIGSATDNAGDYGFAVRYIGDNWVKEIKEFKITVTNGFTYTGDALDDVATDLDYEGTFAFANIPNGAKVAYSITAGALPNGIEMGTDGTLSGTTSQKGDFDFTVTVSVSVTAGRPAVTTVTEYSSDYSMTVGSGTPTAPGGAIVSATINDNNELVITYENGYVSNLGSVEGADGKVPNIGENGNWFIGDTDTGISAQGPKGDTGADGKVADGGCGSLVGFGAAGIILTAFALAAVAIRLVKTKKD